ncbi:MAG: thiamine phosphate synthase [Verrucomicrobiota bacterium]
MKADFRLYLATDSKYLAGRESIPLIAACIERGVTAVQLRDKQATSRELHDLGGQLLDVTRSYGVPLIINDRVDIMLSLGAEGVHVGRDDLPLESVRMLAPKAIVGSTAKTVKDVREAEMAGADYVGVGPVFATETKEQAGPVLGPDGVREIAAASHLPCVAIGGINETNVTRLAGTGVAGVCVIAGILDQDDPGEAASLLRWLMEADADAVE